MSDEEDNVYFNPHVVKQLINDVHEKSRDEARKVGCSICGMRFVPLEKNGVITCPKGHVWEEND